MKAAIHEAIHQGVVRGRYISERPQLDLTGDGPPFVRISSRAIRYRPEDLRVWIQDRVRSSTSDNGGGDR